MKYSDYLSLLTDKLEQLDTWREEFGKPIPKTNRFFLYDIVLQKLIQRLKGNYPFHHPSYAGQMLKPPAPIAWLAYTLASTINPNNHALDGGPPTSEMEKETVLELAKMVGYESHLGHLTSSGTTANLEALWIIKQLLTDGKKLAFSSNAHYTHERLSAVLGIPTIKIPMNAFGEPDWNFLEFHKNEIGALVVTMGTTGMGLVEPLADYLTFFDDLPIHIHVDAAYGGFFKLIESKLPSHKHWLKLSQADSVVVDPHKHGLQPYGCGAVLFKNPEVGRFYKHDSPYTYFTSDELHLGEISLECSRAGASAAAFWATLQVYPLQESGLGAILMDCREAALLFQSMLQENSSFSVLHSIELDIAIYAPNSAKSSSELSKYCKNIFNKGMQAKPDKGFHVSLFQMPSNQVQVTFPNLIIDSPYTTVLRSVFMKPEHLSFIPELIKRLEAAL